MMEWIDLAAEYDMPEFKIGKIQQLSLNGNILPYANVEIHIPNVKLFGKFDVNNFYAIMGKTSNGEPTMDNCEAKINLAKGLNESPDKWIYEGSNDEYVLCNGAFEMSEAGRNIQYSYRMCYIIEIDGKMEYVYSDIVSAILNETEIIYL
jgi:hypothetical protein